VFNGSQGGGGHARWRLPPSQIKALSRRNGTRAVAAGAALAAVFVVAQYAHSATGDITTMAGGGGSLGDGGPATAAQLDQPHSVVYSGGVVFIADSLNDRIRRVDSSGIITTVAGTGTSGFSGDGGPATAAQLNRPSGIAHDASGNLYISEQLNHRIRRVDAGGTITTIAGTGTSGFSGDGGPATSAQLNQPGNVALDAAGNLYIADSQNQRIRRINPSGIITTAAGNGSASFSGDGGPATSAALRFPVGVEIDAAGNILIADTNNHRIRKVDGSGIITTIAGTGSGGSSGDGGPATAAELQAPAGATVDAAGNLFIADSNNEKVRKVDTSGIITTVAGTGSFGFSGDGGPATLAKLHKPYDVSVEPAGHLLIADKNNSRIRRVEGIAVGSAPPPAPVFSGTTPSSPANNNSPLILGSAEAGSTVTLYTNSTCTSTVAGSGTAATFNSPGLSVSVADNNSTIFYATATNAASDTSPCSSSSITYVEDSAAPAQPTLTATTPTSPDNENNPMVSGSAEPGSTVNLYTNSTCTSAVAATGAASAFGSPGLGVTVPDNSTTTIFATATDAAGNTSACSSSSISYVEDSIPPAVPTITLTPTDPGSDPTPTWSFTGEPGGFFSCELSLGGSPIFDFATCTSSHTYDISLEPDGTYTLSVTQTDAAGNTGAAATDDYTLDRSGPAPPTLSSTNPASPANNNTPLILGSAEPGSTVWLYTNSTCTSAVAANGTAAEFNSPGLAVAVPDNSTTTLFATAIDSLGNPSSCSASSISYVEDSAAPTQPTLTATTPASPANDNNPLVSGSAEPGSTVNLYTNSTCTSAVAATGTASVFGSPGLDVSVPDNSTTTFFATATDAAGNTSACSSSSISYVEDSSGAPAAPVITLGPADMSNDNTPTWEFTGDPGVTFQCELMRDTTTVYPLAACSSPQDFDLTAEIDGTYSFGVRAVKLGIPGPFATDSYTLDTGFPSAPAITASPSDPGNDKTPTWGFSGEAGAGFECELTLGGSPIFAFAPCTSSHTYDLTLQPDGSYTFGVRQTDSAGNGPGPVAADDYVLDTSNPAPPAPTVLPPDPDNDSTPTWEFTGEAGATFSCKLMQGLTLIFASAPCSSPNTFDLLSLPDATYTFSVVQVDLAGNTSAAFNDDYTLDTTGPSVSLMATPPAIDNDSTPTWEFTGEPGATFQCQVSRGATILQPFTACSSPFTYNLSGDPDGIYTFTIRALDGVGNPGTSVSDEYTLDRVPPAPSTVESGPGATGNDVTPTWAFSGEPGATFECEVAGGVTIIYALAPCTSPTTFDLSAQPDATYTFTVTQTDTAGNPGPPISVDYLLDTVAPAAPVITSAPTSPDIDPTPSWAFSGEPGATFECQLMQGPTVIFGFAPCTSPAGYDLSSQPDGTYTIEIRQIDQAGNTGPATANSYVYDGPPPAPVFTALPPSAGADTSPTWRFVGEPGTTFECQLSRGANIVLGFAPCMSPATFDLSGLANGDYSLAVRAVDALGRPGAESVSGYTLLRLQPPGASRKSEAPDSPAGALGGDAGEPGGGPPVPGSTKTHKPSSRNPDRTGGAEDKPIDAARLFTALSRAFQFPLLLLLLVLIFLIIQDRIDRSDPKLTQMPVDSDNGLGFTNPPK
jgi:sugar lactone lactonase YvrE